MFYGEEYNIPPCCDQKYFRALWEHLTPPAMPYSRQQLTAGLSDTQVDVLTKQWNRINQVTTSVFMLSDYSLQQVLAKVMLQVPVSTMTLLVPDLSESLIDILADAMNRNWFNGIDSKSHMLERLNLIVPDSVLSSNKIKGLAAAFGKAVHRVTLSKENSMQTIVHIKNAQKEYVLSGTSRQTVDVSNGFFASMIVSNDRTLCRETATVLRIRSRKKIPLE